jgi:hypothetical protein
VNIRHKKVDRVIITGKAEESDMAFRYCLKHQYRITRSGAAMRGRYLMNNKKFKVVAERQLS